MGEWTLTEEQAIKILETEPIKIKEINIFSDTYLTEEEKIKYAAEILETWKRKHLSEGNK